jgi:hypothetical protein
MANTLTVASERHVEVDVRRPSGTVRYRPDSSGRIEPRSKADELVLRDGGATVANPAVAFTSGGRKCEVCGFVGFFTTCGRCGGTCTPETR